MPNPNTTRLNLIQPDTGQTSWGQEVNEWGKKLDQVAAQYLPFHLGGAAENAETFLDGVKFDEEVNITKIQIFARKGPVGGSFTIEIRKNGAATAKTVVIADGAQKGEAAVSGLSFTTTDELGLKVVGVPPSGAVVEISGKIHFSVKPVA